VSATRNVGAFTLSDALQLASIHSKVKLPLFIFLWCLLVAATGAGSAEIRVFVALADNATQRIVPVPAKIGNGDDPANNLYWGCADGLPNVFAASKDWKLVARTNGPAAGVLERRVFEHRSRKLRVIADAYRGSAIQQATADFFAALRSPAPIADFPLAVYIGHNGLMDFRFPAQATGTRGPGRAAIVLCCKSQEYFSPHLEAVDAKPILLTTQLMYPGAFILLAALNGWMEGETSTQMRGRAAQSYAENQKISVKAARGIFSVLPSNARRPELGKN
jgi:hypothetical protein